MNLRLLGWLGALSLITGCSNAGNVRNPSGAASSNDGGSAGDPGAGGRGGSGGQGGSGGEADPPLPTGRYRITMWCGPPGDQMTQARVDEARDAGFNTIATGCTGPFAPDYNTNELTFAEKDDLGVILWDNRMYLAVDGTDTDANVTAVVNDYKNAKALEGYFIADEPSAGAFAGLAAIKNKIAALDPKHFGYINLLPNYASAGQLGEPAYDTYVTTFLDTLKPEVVSWDYYPFNSDGSDSSGFYPNMEDVRTRALAAKVPYWQFVQVESFPGHRATSEVEKLWVATNNLAYGGTSLSYFTYWTLPPSYGFGDAMIDNAGNQTAHYGEAQRVNAKVAAFGKYLSVATSTGVFHNGALPGSTSPRPAFAPAYFPNTVPLVVGTFTVNDGLDAYVFVSNRSYMNAVESDVVLAKTATPPELLDLTTGAFAPFDAVAKTDDGNKVHLALGPAEGALIHLHRPAAKGPPGAEAFIGTVRADQGLFDVVDSSFGALTIATRGWSDPCPTGYASGGRDFESNGFFLCVREDLLAHTFYIGNVVDNGGYFYTSTNGTVTSAGTAGWDTCPAGKEIGRRFEPNGFWMCLD